MISYKILITIYEKWKVTAHISIWGAQQVSVSSHFYFFFLKFRFSQGDYYLAVRRQQVLKLYASS